MKFDFKKVSVSIEYSDGNATLTGFADGDDVINIVRPDDGISTQTGALGDVTTSIVANPVGEGTFILQAQSPSNSLLNSLARTKEAFSLNITENNSQKLQVSMTSCRIVKEADNPRGKNAGQRSWLLRAEKMEINE